MYDTGIVMICCGMPGIVECLWLHCSFELRLDLGLVLEKHRCGTLTDRGVFCLRDTRRCVPITAIQMQML